MGLYTRVVDAGGRVVQIKTGNDALETFSPGDMIQRYSQIKDGVYAGLYEQETTESGALVIIYSQHIVGVIPYTEEDAHLAGAIAWAYRDAMETKWE